MHVLYRKKTSYALRYAMKSYKNSPSGDEIANVNFYAVRRKGAEFEFAEIKQNNAITPFKVIQGHQFWHQSKAHIRFPVSD